jgi:5,10-methylenetetrahydromethanopterin reductase
VRHHRANPAGHRSAEFVAVQFGIGFLGDEDSREVLEWARDLDRRESLSRIWIADEQFLRDPWVQLGAIAAVTTRVSIGICVTDPYIRHPALTATAAATLQELSHGRAILGIGAGSTGFSALGLTPRLPAETVIECIELCRRMWAETAAFSYEGRQVRFIEDHLDFRPPAPIPIYVAARGPKMLAAAAREADAVLIGSFVHGLGLDFALAAIRDAEPTRNPQLPSLRKACWIYLSVGPDAEAARRGAARGLALALRSSHGMLTRIGYEIPTELIEFVVSSRHSWSADEVDWVVTRLPRALIEDLTVAGDSSECARKLRELGDRGIDEVAVLPFAPAGGDVRSTVDRLLDEVAPSVNA